MSEDYEKLGAFYLGRGYDLAAGKLLDDLVLYDSKDLVTHGVCFGMTGSGKTGLCACLLEEALIDRIPVIAVDPKGDLALLRPDLAALLAVEEWGQDAGLGALSRTAPKFKTSRGRRRQALRLTSSYINKEEKWPRSRTSFNPPPQTSGFPKEPRDREWERFSRCFNRSRIRGTFNNFWGACPVPKRCSQRRAAPALAPASPEGLVARLAG
jgi:hypothetical protein